MPPHGGTVTAGQAHPERPVALAAADRHGGGGASRTGAAGLSAPAVLGLQRVAGNAAVSGYLRGRRPPAGGTAVQRRAEAPACTAAVAVDTPGHAAGTAGPVARGPSAVVQRLAGPGSCPAPPVAPVRTRPEQDPRFTSAAADVTRGGKAVAAHPPAAAEAKAAQDAAVAPAEDKEAQAKAAQADKMSGAKPGTFDKAAFVAAVNQAVAAQAPKNLDEADKFADSGKADTVKTQVLDKVTTGKAAAARDIAEKSTETPDPSKAVDKPVTPLPAQQPPPRPAPPDPAKAAPAKAPAEQTELGAAACETNTAMADAGVTEPQLAHSNESDFTGALKAKQEGEVHSAAAPAAVRQQEAQQLSAAQAAAASTGKAGVEGMVAAKTQAGQKLSTGKAEAKAEDEAKRAEVTAAIKRIFDTTKADVDKILGDLDGLVAKQFEDGEARAKAAFTADHKARMQRYKDERYSGAAGWARWTADLFTGLPPEANQIFLESKKLYESQLQQVSSEIADTVGRELGRAKDRIAAGRTEIAAFVAKQPKELQSVGNQAAKEFGSQLDQMEETVADKGRSVVDDLAQKYVEARTAVDEEIKALQAENKGLWDKAKEAVGGVIETIMKLKDMLLGVLARAAAAIDKIIKDPVGFLGNLVNAVRSGIVSFGHNIADHLKKGLQGWLLGALANAGIELPDKFDLKGIVKLILSLLGLTWANIRARILKVIPEPVLKVLESTVAVVGVLVGEGVGGLWKWIVEKLSDLKEMVLGQIKEFVVEKIVKAGITWLISLLNPAAAFIKAGKMIYDVVMFFVDKAAQIKEFADSVLDSVESIATGGVGRVAGLIENTLAKILPLVLGFLAGLLGLGGISEKIKKVLETVQKPVMKVVDAIIGGIVKAGKGLLKKLGFGRKKVAEKDVGPKLDLKQPFSMNGQSHTLFATVKNNKVVVEMASVRRQMLETTASAAESEAATTQNMALARDLSAVRAKLQRVEHLELNVKRTAEVEREMATLLTDAAGLLADIGRNYGLKSLASIRHGSLWVTAEGELKEEYRGVEFRPKVYGSWDNDNRSGGTFRRTELARLRALMLANPASWSANTLFARTTAYYCPKGNHLADNATGSGVLSLDHRTSVKIHWASHGYNSRFPARNDWYNGKGTGTGNLESMCQSCNSAKGSSSDAPASYQVGPDFRGRGES